ncbi:MAG: SUMF1/EgtB/PvdO family nonheme iron enzyme [Candidatus Cloacimonetes bacterium]|nr:SUMF1/EgtB/PvdO family nonheme iron enzyme [Candidatus Cloacimonadota bacterium]
MKTNILSNYQIIQNLHRSSRFSIYLATQMDNNRTVLIKTPDAIRINDAELNSVLLSEIAAHSKLNHPRIRACYHSFTDDDTAFMIGEYYEGKSLVRCLGDGEGPKDLETALGWITDILEALAHAQAQGILHLGLNPYNIIVDKNNHLNLIGFGKSPKAFLHGEEDFSTYHPILFAAPELFQAGIALPASDVFSCAVLAYFILCGVLPWRIDLQLSFEKQKNQSLSRAVIMPEILKKQVPDWLFAILLQCLKLDPQQRLNSAAEMLFAINSNRGEQLAIISPSSDSIHTVQPEVEPSIEIAEPEENTLSQPEIPVAEPQVPQQTAEMGSDTTEEYLQAIPEDLSSISSLLNDLASEAEPVAEEDILPDIILTEHPEPEPVTPEDRWLPHAAAKEVIPQVEHIQEPKPNTPPPLQTYKQHVKQEEENAEIKETKSLKKTFRALLILSALVVIFVVVKYYVLQPKPKFNTEEETTEITETEAASFESNKLVSMILVPADTLVMGSISPDADDDEFPLITIKVDAFYISEKEITQAEWQMVSPHNPSQFKDSDLPVENVSFYDAIEFCNAKSSKDGYKPCYEYYDTEVVCDFAADGYRLPTEAEWELASKSGMQRDFSLFSGSNNADEVGWYNSNSNARSHAGAQKKPNQLGIYDLSGNMFEWVWNWYAPYSYKIADPFNGPNSGTDKVIRGGSWYHPMSEMRVSNRNFAKPYTKAGFIGFRVVRTAQ